MSVSMVAAGVMLVAWFPTAALVAQRRTLDASAASLTQMRSQDRALRSEARGLSSPSEVVRIAREQFGLVAPGTDAYQVLPAAGVPGSGVPALSDPSPSAGPDAPSDRGLGAAGSTERRDATGASQPGGMMERVLHTLEFWR
ncbi:MAG: FtsB family cell division protein [Acidimicrobiales bacterium]